MINEFPTFSTAAAAWFEDKKRYVEDLLESFEVVFSLREEVRISG